MSREQARTGAEEVGKVGIGDKRNWKEGREHYLFLWSRAFYLAHLYCNTVPELTSYCQSSLASCCPALSLVINPSADVPEKSSDDPR